MNGNKKKRIALYGTGKYGKTAYSLLQKDYIIVCFSDSDCNKWSSTIYDIPIVPPYDLPRYGLDMVVIAILKYRAPLLSLEELSISNIFVFLPFYRKDCVELQYRLANPSLNFDSLDDHFVILENSSENKKIVNSNSQSNRKVLMIAALFPPEGGGGVQRPYKFCKYLQQYGYNPTVICRGYADWGSGVDFSLVEDVDIEIINLQNEPIIFDELNAEDQQSIIDIYSEIIIDDGGKYNDYVNRFGRFLPDNEIIWVYLSLKRVSQLINLDEYEIVYTTLPPYSDAIFGYYLKKLYGMKWVVDYRDAWCLNEFCMRTVYQKRQDTWVSEKKIEIALLSAADYIVTASDALCDDFKKNVPMIPMKCITNGYDETDFRNKEYINHEYFALVYNGTIYDHYCLEVVIDAINELIDDGLILQSEIRYIFCGNNYEMYSERIKKADKNGIVSYCGYLSHEQSISYIMSADILVLFGAYDEGAYYTYTGKIFEYLRTGNPIISFSSSYGLHYEMIEKTGRGITVAPEDKEKLKNYIFSNFMHWKKEGHVYVREVPDNIVHYSREHLTLELASVFDTIVDK